MVNYRRLKIPGGIYFFTLIIHDRRSNLLTEHISLLGAAMRRARESHPYKTVALVVLPDHLHAMWELPEDDDQYSLRWSKIKSYFTRGLAQEGILSKPNHRREYTLWQHRFWEHAIRNDKDFENHANYIHYNPVKHRLVKNVCDWPFSTFHRYVQQDVLPANWGDDGLPEPDFSTGE